MIERKSGLYAGRSSYAKIISLKKLLKFTGALLRETAQAWAESTRLCNPNQGNQPETKSVRISLHRYGCVEGRKLQTMTYLYFLNKENQMYNSKNTSTLQKT